MRRSVSPSSQSPALINRPAGGLAEANAAGAMFIEDFARAAALYRELVAVHPQDARLLLAYETP